MAGWRRTSVEIQARSLKLTPILLKDLQIFGARSSLSGSASDSIPELEFVLAAAGEGSLVLQLLEIAEGESSHAGAVVLVMGVKLVLGALDLRSETLDFGCEGFGHGLVGSALRLTVSASSDSNCRKAPLIFKLHVSRILQVERHELGLDDVKLELKSRESRSVRMNFRLQCLKALLIHQICSLSAVLGGLGIGALLRGDGAVDLDIFLELEAIGFEFALFGFEGLGTKLGLLFGHCGFFDLAHQLGCLDLALLDEAVGGRILEVDVVVAHSAFGAAEDFIGLIQLRRCD